jgi:hypothetical protein
LKICEILNWKDASVSAEVVGAEPLSRAFGDTMTKQSGIIRRPDFAGGGITDEERERMAAHSALWID